MRRKKKLQSATMKIRGMIQPRTSPIQRLGTSPVYFTPLAVRSSMSFGSSIRTAVKPVPSFPVDSFRVPRTRSSATVTSCTLPSRTSALKSLYEIVLPVCIE